MQAFSKNLKQNISITLTLKTPSCNFITGLWNLIFRDWIYNDDEKTSKITFFVLCTIP
jgi:hypothetical protein